jgi:hypothetical protein
MRGAIDADTIDLSKEIRSHAPKALELLISILETPAPLDQKTQVKVAMDLLDRAGYAAPKYVYGQFAHAHLTASDIDEIKDRAHKRRMLGGNGDATGNP